jgi:hypothetical protein
MIISDLQFLDLTESINKITGGAWASASTQTSARLNVSSANANASAGGTQTFTNTQTYTNLYVSPLSWVSSASANADAYGADSRGSAFASSTNVSSLIVD